MPAKYFVLVFILNLFSVIPGNAQTHKIDSLKQLTCAAKNEKEQLQALLFLCDEFETLPKDTLWAYAVQAKELAVKTNNTQAAGWAVLAEAEAYLRWANTDSAKAIIAPELLKYTAKDPRTRDLYFRLRQVKTDCNDYTGNFEEGLAEIYSIMAEAEQYDDSLVMAESMNTIGCWKWDLDAVDESRAWGLKGLSHTGATPRYYRVIIGLSVNLADNYWWTGKLDSAMYYADKAADLSRQIENLNFLSLALQKKANIYIARKEYGKAEQMALESIRLAEQTDKYGDYQDKIMVLASVYRNAGQLDKAIKVLNDGLALDSTYSNTSAHSKQRADKDILQKIFYYQTLATCYKLKGDNKNYEATLEKIISGKDAFYKANSAQAIAEMQTKFETQKKEATIAQQQYRLIRKNYFIYGTLGLLAATLLIGFAIFKNRQKNQQLKLQEMAIDNEQAIQNAKEDERQRILADLHDDVGGGLSSIRMVSDLIIQQHQQVQQVNEYALKISRISQEVTLRMNTIVWALNSENDTLQNLCEYIREYGYTFFENSSIAFESKIPENIDNVDLGGLQRKNIFLCVKEALHNTLKHSNAKKAWLNITWEDNRLRILFADNGQGMVKENQFGNGLRNIQKRMKEINGSVTFGTKEGVEMVLELHI